MRKVAVSIIAASIFLCSTTFYVHGQEVKALPSKGNSEAFTGKVMREKVRLRLQPNLDSPIVKELNRNDLLIVLGETEDFYAVQPPASIKGYVYRPYVLDGVVEGNRVNVRLSPHLEAPVIAQLNSGDKVEGSQSVQNNKWLEIAPPSSTRFYVATDYIEKVGDVNFLSIQASRLQDALSLLSNTYLYSQTELQKPFSEINPEKILNNYRIVIEGYKDFPDQVVQAKECLSKFQDEYLHKKIAFLESRSKASELEREQLIKATAEKLAQEGHRPSALLAEAENPSPCSQYNKWISKKYPHEVNAKMIAWVPAEMGYYENWAADHEQGSLDDFYEDQKKQTVALEGIVEPYGPFRNKPGDFVLINRNSHLPVAYLYSTHINLQDKVGQEIHIEGVLRPNNNFAHPAYFVLSVN